MNETNGDLALTSEYRSIVIRWETEQSEPRAANRTFRTLHEYYKTLRGSETGRSAISYLMNDVNPSVRLMAATHSLAWSPVKAEQVLMQLEDESGPNAVTAKYTLREFKHGTLNLDW